MTEGVTIEDKVAALLDHTEDKVVALLDNNIALLDHIRNNGDHEIGMITRSSCYLDFLELETIHEVFGNKLFTIPPGAVREEGGEHDMYLIVVVEVLRKK